MVGSQHNFDLLQLEEKASGAMQVMEVYSRHPDWDRGSRRLSGSLDSWNVKSWTGCVDTRKVNVPLAWSAGMARARARFQATELFDAKELDFAALAALPEGISVMQPQGKRVGAQLPAVP
jgi:predicted nicotinamide N-methyase